MTRILAVETVGTTGSVAAMEGDHLLSERPLEARIRSARSLAPGIRDLLAEVNWRPGDVQLVAVATGPGSFTGLRIGVTTAKTFAYSVGCQTVGVHTLLAIAWRTSPDIQKLTVILDAQRNELFVADFERSADGTLSGQETTRIIANDGWLAGLVPGDIVSGPGLEKLIDRLPEGVRTIEPDLRLPTAGAVGRVGWAMHRAGQSTSAVELLPAYFRATSAEEQWQRKNT